MSENLTNIESIYIEKKEKANKLNQFIDKITQKIFDLKEKNSQILESNDKMHCYKRLIVNLLNFLDGLENYNTSIKSAEKAAEKLKNEKLSSEEREATIRELEVQDEIRKLEHDSLMKSYICMIDNYKILFGKEDLSFFPLIDLFFTESGEIKPEFLASPPRDKNGNLIFNLNSFDSKTRNQFSKEFTESYKEIQNDSELKEIFEMNKQLIEKEEKNMTINKNNNHKD